MSKKPTPDKGNRAVPIVRAFRHYRTGKLIRAEDYGVNGFPMWGRLKKPKS